MNRILVVSSPAPSPDEQPEAVLRAYRVFAAADGHHFAGLNGITGRGRVSTAVASWDSDTMTGITSSGRRYRLEGPPDATGMAEVLYVAWAHDKGLVEHEDVTSDYAPSARPGLN